MQVKVIGDNHVRGSADLAREIESSAEAALKRFGKQITRVEVHLADAGRHATVAHAGDPDVVAGGSAARELQHRAGRLLGWQFLEPERHGDVVDVLASSDHAAAATAPVLATGVRVLAVPNAADAVSGLDDGALVVVATTPSTAAVLARAAVSARLSVVIRSG